MLSSWQPQGSPALGLQVSPRHSTVILPRMRLSLPIRRALSLIERNLPSAAAMECSPAFEKSPALRRDGRISIADFAPAIELPGCAHAARPVKLDPSLIPDIDTSEYARNIVQAVVQLVKSVWRRIVAEGSRMRPCRPARAMGSRRFRASLRHPMFEENSEWPRTGRPRRAERA